MDRDSLQLLLGQGVSIERIAKRFRKDPSTVSYWVHKHGLESPYRAKHAPKGGIERDRLEDLIQTGSSITTIAEILQRSPVPSVTGSTSTVSRLEQRRKGVWDEKLEQRVA